MTNEWSAYSEYRQRRQNEFAGQCQCANGGARYGSTGTSTNKTTIQDAVWVASLATLSHGPRDAIADPTEQPSVFAGRSGVASTVPVTAGSVQPSVVATTVPVDVPFHQETKEAFQEVSSAFQDMYAKHGQSQGSLQVLASTVEAMK